MAKILVVDDQESVLKTVEAILKKAGHEVVTASDGYIALEKIEIESYDLLITDANMPGISGFDLVKSLRMGEKTKQLPIIMLTSRQDKRDVEKAIQVKVDDYILKPVDPDLIVGKVAVLFARSGTKKIDIEVNEDAELKVGVRVTAVNETGLHLACTVQFAAGARFPLHSPIFAKIGIPAQEMRVTECRNQGKGFAVKAVFVGLASSDLEKLQNWIANRPSARAS